MGGRNCLSTQVITVRSIQSTPSVKEQRNLQDLTTILTHALTGEVTYINPIGMNSIAVEMGLLLKTESHIAG